MGSSSCIAFSFFGEDFTFMCSAVAALRFGLVVSSLGSLGTVTNSVMFNQIY